MKTLKRLIPLAAVAAGVSFTAAAETFRSAIPGYQILEYLESTGAQYIDTKVQYGNNMKLEQRFSVAKDERIQMMMGAINSSGSSMYRRFHWGMNNQSQYLKFIGSNGENTSLPVTDGWAEMSAETSGTTYSGDISGLGTLYLFARNNNGTADAFGKFRVKATRIWMDKALVRDFVPVKRIEDNALGLYDRCYAKFYQNDGDGVFVEGPVYTGITISRQIPDQFQSIDSAVSPCCPLPKVVDGATGKVLRRDTDYTVSWADNDHFGRALCAVTGIGDYAKSDPTSADFYIAPEAEVPSEYQRLFYLESTGTVHWIDTELHAADNLRMTVLAQMTVASGSIQVAGILDGSGSYNRFHLTVKRDNNASYLVASLGANESTTSEQRTKLQVNMGWNMLTMDAANLTQAVNDNSMAISKSGSLPTASTIWLFGRNGDSSRSGAPMRIADAVLYEGGVKMHEYVPCRRKADGVLGMYDAVGKRFFPKSDSAEGGFLAGPDLNGARQTGLIFLLK